MAKKNSWDAIEKQIEALKKKRDALMRKEGQKVRKKSIVDLVNERIERFNLADSDEDLRGDSWDGDVDGDFVSYNQFTGTGESGEPFTMTRQEVVDQANETYNDRIGDSEFDDGFIKDVKAGVFSKADLLKLSQGDCWLWKVDEANFAVPSWVTDEKDIAERRKCNEESLQELKTKIAATHKIVVLQLAKVS